MQRVLQDVYGHDLDNPPEEAKGRGALPREPHQALWEHNSPERWHQIAEKRNPQPVEEIPGMPPRQELVAQMLAALGMTPADGAPGQ